jgi:hypothetical protein
MIILNASSKHPTYVDPAAIVTCRRSWGSTTVRTRDGELFEAAETPADIARLRAAWRNRHEHEIGGVAITAIKLVNGVVLADFFETTLGDA